MKRLLPVLILGALFALAYGCKKDTPLPEEKVVTEPAPVPKAELPSALLLNIQTSGHPDARLQVPTLDELTAMNDKFVTVEVNPDFTDLSDDDRAFLVHVIAAAEKLDQIYWNQNSVDGNNYRTLCQSSGLKSPYDTELCDFVMLNYGRYDRTTGEAFVKTGTDDKRPGYGTFYPSDFPKEGLAAWMNVLPPDQKAQATSPYTIIRKQNPLSEVSSLEVVPYNMAYQPELNDAATELLLAADFADSPSQRNYMLMQAQAFNTNDYSAADTAWVLVQDSKFLVVMGPYEVYDDEYFGYKAAYEAFVAIRDQKVTEGMSAIDEHRDEIEDALPLDKKFTFEKSGIAPVIAVNSLYNAGQANAGVKFSAFMLPNDEDVRNKVGSLNIMNLTAQNAKFKKGMLPIANLVLTPEQMKLVSWTAYSWHNITHELGHGMGPGVITMADGRKSTVKLELTNLYSPFEECKADVLGFWMIPYLVKFGVLPETAANETAVTSLSGFFRSVRFGLHEAHARANLLQYNYLVKNGVYVQDSATSRYYVDLDKFYPVIEKMLGELLLIEAEGNYQAAQAFIDTYGGVPPEVEKTVAGLVDLPIDIKFDFVGARSLGALK